MNRTRSGFWRDFWALFKPYWFSEDRLIARLLLLSIIALTLGMVYMNVRINEWQNLFLQHAAGQGQGRVLSTDSALRATRGDMDRDVGVFTVLDSDVADPLASMADRQVPQGLAHGPDVLSDAAQGQVRPITRISV